MLMLKIALNPLEEDGVVTQRLIDWGGLTKNPDDSLIHFEPGFFYEELGTFDEQTGELVFQLVEAGSPSFDPDEPETLLVPAGWRHANTKEGIVFATAFREIQSERFPFLALGDRAMVQGQISSPFFTRSYKYDNVAIWLPRSQRHTSFTRFLCIKI
jgi:hypothetical protein